MNGIPKELLLSVGGALLCAFAVSFLMCPLVKSFAYKIGAIDVPKDNRRMHKKPVPRLGGLAIFLGFIVSMLLFVKVDHQLQGILLGASIIVVLGVVDDMSPLRAYFKFCVQIFAALVAVFHGVVIQTLSNPNVFAESPYWDLGWLSIPITVLWIVGITNAVNLIDGLDGLACGVSTISAISMLVIALLVSESDVALVMAAPLRAYFKFCVQIFAALVAVFHGVVIQTLSNPNVFAESPYWDLGWLSIPITVLWIVGITNAVNLIDGLDGLACGVSTISAISMLVIALLVSESDVALVMAALVGACLGFMPYNKNPAKMFMGDTGSTFLGYILATISIQGLFKYYAIVSFAVPFLILGLPMFDTLFAIIRRLAHGQNPMAPDRGHIHHRLIDMGLNQKQAVAALYVISSILGLSAVMLTSSGAIKAMLFLMALAVAAFLASRVIFRRDIDRALQAEKAAAEEKSTETATPAETVPAEPEEESNEKKKEEA